MLLIHYCMVLVNTKEKEEEMAEQLLYKPFEAAESLRLGRSKIYELLATGELRSIRVGRAIRVPASALKEYVEKQEAANPQGKN